VVVPGKGEDQIAAFLADPERGFLPCVVEPAREGGVEELVVHSRLIGVEQAADEGFSFMRRLKRIEEKCGSFCRLEAGGHGAEHRTGACHLSGEPSPRQRPGAVDPDPFELA
jgi:hypothetical protein